MDFDLDAFLEIDDPRAENARHDLSELLFIALAAVICGAEDSTDIAVFGRSKQVLLKEFLELRYGVPSHDTFSRVFRILDPVQFAALLERFAAAFHQALKLGDAEVISLDGKASRRAYEVGKATVPPMSVTAWASGLRLSLGYVACKAGGEAAAAIEVLRLIRIAGATVTGDALHCTRAMAAAVKDGGGDYLLALKGNQKGLQRDAEARLKSVKGRSVQARERRKGKAILRTARVVPAGNMAEKHKFTGLAAVVEIVKKCGRKSERRLWLASKRLSPTAALKLARAHWDIENRLHWSMDVTFKEDASRARKDNAPHTLAILRRLAMNLVTSVDSKLSIRARVKRAGWDDDFLKEALCQMR